MLVVRMQAHMVGVGGGRAVAQLRAVPDPDNATGPGGTASIVVNDPEALDTFKEGAIYELSIKEVAAEPEPESAPAPTNSTTRTRSR